MNCTYHCNVVSERNREREIIGLIMNSNKLHMFPSLSLPAFNIEMRRHRVSWKCNAGSYSVFGLLLAEVELGPP